ncbi:MAG: glycosyltransferase family 4 protein [Pseudomonadota bacterium]
MKIVHVLTSLLRAGAEENTLATCAGQVARGHEVWLVHGREQDPETRASVAPGIQVIAVPDLVRDVRPVRDIAALRRLTRLLREIQPAVVHTHQSKAGFIGRVAARNARVPIIIHGVHILPFMNVGSVKRRIYLGMERYVASVTDAFIAVAQGMHDANLAAGLGSKDSNHIVYSGMDIDRFRNARPTTDAPPGRMIALVASLEPRKRHADFFQIFARLRKRWPDLNLCLFGQGEMEATLRDLAVELGIDGHVHFMGFRTDVEQWIAAADLCVLPSMREGLPRVVVQYVAVGKPVIVSRLPGIEEIVTHNENGLLVGLDDLSGMEEAIDQLLSDKELAQRMGLAARNRDLSQWSLTRMDHDIDAIMMQIAERKSLV